ncbi:hypothetical protein [Pedobacter jejuensis]|uniref:Uncharacterized protein n=1 Tax=Pedobacter jejuensis TaxID=1268550 RepID=A0A3N0BS60_9SPHI|nr:hypothetical protein [Pedobacter jejuensis]RNL51458.1 hypothetical protein D7004_14635 [Pedobacter jejuensis]
MAETLNVKSNGNIFFILISELPTDEQAPFKQWLHSEGQTQPLIDKQLDGNCAYPWDYELWKSNPNATHLL